MRKKAPINTSGIKKKNDRFVKDLSIEFIKNVQPSSVTLVKIAISEQKIVSKFVQSKFGFAFRLPQKYPGTQSLNPQKSSSGWGTPVSIFTHLFFRYPAKSYKPAIAKIKKKNNRTIIVSLSKGNEDNRAETITLRPSILDIDLSGLNTLKALRPERFRLPPCKIRGM